MNLIMYFVGFVLAASLLIGAVVWAENLSKEIDTPEWKCPYERTGCQ